MKIAIILGAGFMIANIALAKPAAMICTEKLNGVRRLPLVVLLTQKKEREIKEHKEEPFSAEVFQSAYRHNPIKENNGNVVMHNDLMTYTSKDESVIFTVSLDELDNGSLTLDGKSVGTFSCKEFESSH